MDANGNPDAKPPEYTDQFSEAAGNIVIHPGDTLTLGDTAESLGIDTDHGSFFLFDRNGHQYAVLECERNGDGWRVYSIRFVSTISRRELLPIHSQPEPDPIDQSHREPLPVGNSITVANAYSSTIFVARPINGSGAFYLTHHHSHTHTGDDGDALPHAHDHAHTGADAHRAGQYGHGRDLHDHAHDGDPDR